MIRHVAMFKWNDDELPSHAVATGTALEGLTEVITSIVAFRHGPDLGVSPGTFDYSVTADFHDVEGYLAYRDHPAHQAFLTGFIVGHVAQRVAVQFEWRA